MIRLPALLAFALALAGAPASAWQKAGPGQVSRENIIGFWTDDGDCANVIEMRADGIFVTAEGGRGSWLVADGVITLSGPGGTISRTIILEDPDTILLIAKDGEQGRSTRCPGPAPGPPDSRPTLDTI